MMVWTMNDRAREALVRIRDKEAERLGRVKAAGQAGGIWGSWAAEDLAHANGLIEMYDRGDPITVELAQEWARQDALPRS